MWTQLLDNSSLWDTARGVPDNQRLKNFLHALIFSHGESKRLLCSEVFPLLLVPFVVKPRWGKVLRQLITRRVNCKSIVVGSFRTQNKCISPATPFFLPLHFTLLFSYLTHLSSRSDLATTTTRMPTKVDDLQDDVPNNINPYKVLEIEKSATPDQIKTAYRRLALRHHPGM